MANNPAPPWPPSILEGFDIKIAWGALLEDMPAHGLEHETSPFKRALLHLQLLDALEPGKTPVQTTAPPVPFLFVPRDLFSSFRGVGTDNREHARRLCFYGIITYYWNEATKAVFGSENMVKHLCMCLRCYKHTGTEHLAVSKLESFMPMAQHQFFYTMASVCLQLANYSIMTKPPAECTREQLEKCIGLLNGIEQEVTVIVPPSKFSKWHKSMLLYIQTEKKYCVGVYILVFLKLPFSAVPQQSYLNVRDTAKLYLEARACLQQCPAKRVEKYLSDIERKMASGYHAECRDVPSFHSIIHTPAFCSGNTCKQPLIVDTVLQETPETTRKKIYAKLKQQLPDVSNK